jgi:hypothetical protein
MTNQNQERKIQNVLFAILLSSMWLSSCSVINSILPAKTPVWGKSLNYDSCYTDCALDADGIWTIEATNIQQNLYFWNSYSGFPYKYLKLIESSFQVDLLVSDAGYDASDYDVIVDLHGMGTVRSWYAQIGYLFSNKRLTVFCQGYSYSSDAPRFWQEVDRQVQFDEWHTFKIEVFPTSIGWHYKFFYFMDGENICEYQPPDKWDGDNRYRVIFQDIEVKPSQDNLFSNYPIRAKVKNYYSFIADMP